MNRIGLVSTLAQTPWAASEELWSQAALRLAQSGHRVGVNVQHWRPAPPRLGELAAAGADVFERQWNYRWQRILGERYLQRRYDWLDRFRPELLILSLDHQSAGVEWMEACHLRGIPYLPIVQSVCETSWPGDKHNFRLRDAYQRAVAPCFLSRRNLAATCLQFGAPLKKARILHDPPNVSFDAAPAWPAADGTYKLACVARLRPGRKGQDVLFATLRSEKWQQRPVTLTLFGDDESRTTLESLAAMYGLRNITFAGYQPNVESIWATHHALVLPSRYDGLPMAIVEAMLCARPCIATDVSGASELIEDNVSGFLADAPTPALLDEALERAWQRREEWPAIGQAAAARIRTLAPRDPVGLFVGQIETLLGESKGRRLAA